MTALTIRLPNSVHDSIKQLARKDGISVNQFIASAAAKKMAAFQTLQHLRVRRLWANGRTSSAICPWCPMRLPQRVMSGLMRPSPDQWG